MNYLDKLKHLNQRPDTGSTIQADDRITWTRADGTTHTGIVDYLHVDDTGARWAFVSIGATWAAINLKCATVRPDADLKRISPMSQDLFPEWSEGR